MNELQYLLWKYHSKDTVPTKNRQPKADGIECCGVGMKCKSPQDDFIKKPAYSYAHLLLQTDGVFPECLLHEVVPTFHYGTLHANSTILKRKSP